MNNKFLFQIFTPALYGTLTEQLEDIELQLLKWCSDTCVSFDALLQARIYLTDAINQWQQVLESPLFLDFLSRGAVSFIEQPLLNGMKVAVQLSFSNECPVVKRGTPDKMQIEVGDCVLYFHSVRFMADEVRGMDSEEQTKEAFSRHICELGKLGMNLRDNCHRTWIYVRDIDKNYGGVVAGRNTVFREQGLTAESHYISSTGIGGYPDNQSSIVSLDFFSVKGLGDSAVDYLHALEYLNPTHEYGVAFERGTKVCFGQTNLFLISGTASIDKYGQCLHRGDVMTQTGRLFLNIEKLLEDGGASLADLQYMIVYLRDVADYVRVNRYLRLRFPKVPFLIVEAKVCRPEWLIEVECVAQN